jgi:hypothetical protein
LIPTVPKAAPVRFVVMRYYIEAEINFGARQEHWAETEEAALELVRTLLRKDAAVAIVLIPDNVIPFEAGASLPSRASWVRPSSA